MSDLIVVSPEERAEIEKPASQIVAAARDFKILGPANYEMGGERLKEIKGAQKELEVKKRKLLDPVNATLRAIRELFQGPEAELNLAESLYKKEMLAFSRRQELERQEAQRKLDEAAERERQKRLKEAAEAEERARAAREAGNLKQAEKLERKAGRAEDMATSIVAQTATVDKPHVSGVSERETWSAVVIDKMALIKAVAEGKVPDLALEPNMKFLNAQARAMKKQLAYPGVRPARETGIAAGSR